MSATMHTRETITEALSPRELQVATMAPFYTAQEIADHLGVARATVDATTTRARLKLGVKTKNELGRLMFAVGLIGGDEE